MNTHSTIEVVAWTLASWLVISVVMGFIVGAWIAHCDERAKTPKWPWDGK